MKITLGPQYSDLLFTSMDTTSDEYISRYKIYVTDKLFRI